MRFRIIFKVFLFSTLINGCGFSINNDDENLNLNELTLNQDAESNLDITNKNPFSFLALGDSYTIGEGVNEDERWPNQFVDIANENNVNFDKPKIIATTGWKTHDLINAINNTNFTNKYDYISLLIGVNNQFNSRPIEEFEEDLNKLMKKMMEV